MNILSISNLNVKKYKLVRTETLILTWYVSVLSCLLGDTLKIDVFE